MTLNAIDQTLPQLLQRIARQVDMRWEIEGNNLVVMRDTPFLRLYKVDYVNLARDARSVANVSTQVSGAAQPGAATTSSGGLNNTTAVINSVSANKFWDTLVGNIKEILQETDKVLPGLQAAVPLQYRASTAGGSSGRRARDSAAGAGGDVPRGRLGHRESRKRRPQYPRHVAPA